MVYYYITISGVLLRKYKHKDYLALPLLTVLQPIEITTYL